MSNIVPFQDMQGMAEAIAKSGLFGMKDVNSVLALMAVAQAEGLHPATAARDYHIIQGRPALKADAMLARFQQAGGKVDWTVYTDTTVTGLFSHPNGGSLEMTWTINQAQKAGLVKPGSGWEKYPRAMLRSRVVSEGIRTVYPGCVIGTYTPEEVGDFEPPVKTREMGQVEVVPTHPFSDMADDIPEGTESRYQVYLPDGSVYKRFDTEDEWCSCYASMIARIDQSEKFTEEQKTEKLEAFREANAAVKKNLTPMRLAQLAKQVSNNRKHNPKTSAHPLTDLEHSEAES